MKMPSTTAVKVEAKVSPEAGDATKQCINCLEKKVRNLEKRKTKIEQNQEKAKKGSKLEKEQEVSLHSYDQVTHDLEFARELHKQFQQIFSEHEKMSKKQAKREKVERQAQEIKRVSEILQLQSLLDLLGGDKVREDFKTGKHGAVVLTEDKLNQLDELYQVISPTREESGYSQRLTTAAEHLVAILDGKDRQVVGTTYKEIKELITLINGCGYFEKVSSEEETEAAEEEPEVSQEEVEEETPEPELDTADTEAAQEESEDQDEEQPTPSEQQPIDLTVGTPEVAEPQQDLPSQHLSTIEQDAFFAPSSKTYQVEPEPQFPQQSHTATSSSSSASLQASDFQSFTNNRPFQFIQTSYIMPEVAADPAVIAAQPVGASGLQFMSQSFESSATQQQQPQPQKQQQQQQQQQQLQTQQPDLTLGGQQAQQQQQQDFSSQSFGQAGLHQDQSQLDQQTQQQQQEKKFQMNASAPVFQSMYSQVPTGPGAGMPVSVPPPTGPPTTVGGVGVGSVDQLNQAQTGMPSDFSSVQGPPPPSTAQSNGDYGSQSGGAGDFQVYPGNGFNSGFSRGGRGGFRGGRGGPGGNGGNRNGGMQNGFSSRGSGGPGNPNSGRGGRGNYQGYPPNSGYRPDGYQGGYNAGGASGGGGFGNQVYSKRGGNGMGGSGGQGGGQGYNRGGGGNMGGRGGAGGMRGGMPRGAGQGPPRGAPRGGQFNRPTPAQ